MTSKNELICFGSNEFGQCGDGKYGESGLLKSNFDVNMNLKGRTIEILECGGAHTMVLTISQELFSFGLNEQFFSVLGNPHTPEPMKMTTFAHWFRH